MDFKKPIDSGDNEVNDNSLRERAISVEWAGGEEVDSGKKRKKHTNPKTHGWKVLEGIDGTF